MIPVTIIDPEKVAWKGEADQVVFAIGDGLVGIRPGHADAAFELRPCVVRISTGATEKKPFVSGGMARVEKGTLKVLADTAESPEQIDRERAQKAAERARKRLEQASQGIDYERARLALMRSIMRLQAGA